MEHQNQTTGAIDAGLKDIVDFLILNVEEEVHSVCPQCVFSLPPPIFINSTQNNHTNGTNGTN
jgi:hypothetical protein